MAIRTKAQPYRLDWQKAKSLEDANAKLQKLWIASDDMFEILFKELRRVGAAIDEAVAGATGATGAAGTSGSGSGRTLMVGSFSADYADTSGWADGEMWWPPGDGTSGGGGGSSSTSGYWAPLTDGNIIETDLVFANGDAIMVFVPTP